MEYRYALITGASSGIGYHIAHALAQQGLSCVLVARRKYRLEELEDELLNLYPEQRFHHIEADLVSETGRKTVQEWFSKHGIFPEIFINNAGIGTFGPVSREHIQTARNMLALNVEALSELTYWWAREAVTQKKGTLVLVSSVLGFFPCPYMATYSATKAYVLSFGLALRYELARYGVRVFVLCPGATRTEFQEKAGMTHLTMIYMKPEKVARITARHIVKSTHRPLIIPGLMNKLSVILMRRIPPSWASSIMGFLIRHAKHESQT